MTSTKLPPLSKPVLEQLRKDAANVRAAAERKEMTLSRSEEAEETQTAKQYFNLGCWLFYYQREMYKPGVDSLKMQIDTVVRLFRNGFFNPGYAFYTVFNFGEREWDTVFEMENSSEVLQGVRAIYAETRDPLIAEGFAYAGWSLVDDRQLALFSE